MKREKIMMRTHKEVYKYIFLKFVKLQIRPSESAQASIDFHDVFDRNVKFAMVQTKSFLCNKLKSMIFSRFLFHFQTRPRRKQAQTDVQTIE